MGMNRDKINLAVIFLLGILLLSACKARRQHESASSGGFRALGITLDETAHRPLAEAVKKWIGTPYVHGGTTRSGVDCSGFVQEIIRDVWKKEAPRTSEEQYRWAKPVQKEKQKGGDLVFFRISGKKISHVGLMLDRTYFVHASTSKGVRVDDIIQPYWANVLHGFGSIP